MLNSTLTHLSMETPAGLGFVVFYYPALAVLNTVGWLILLVLFRHLLRNDAGALIMLWLATSFVGLGSGGFLVDYPVALISLGFLILVFRRVGALALVAGFVYYYMIMRLPLKFNLNQWYALRSTAGLLLLVAIGAYGFWTALAGKPLFGSFLAEEEAVA